MRKPEFNSLNTRYHPLAPETIIPIDQRPDMH